MESWYIYILRVRGEKKKRYVICRIVLVLCVLPEGVTNIYICMYRPRILVHSSIGWKRRRRIWSIGICYSASPKNKSELS